MSSSRQATGLDWFAVIVASVAFAGMLQWKWDVIPVVLGGGLLGLFYTLSGGR